MRDAECRFSNNREKYLLFTTTCSESRATAKRVGEEFRFLNPQPPALRIYQAGSGEGTLLNRILRQMHSQWPTLPYLVVVRELNPDFLRLAVRNIADRFHEHPELVLIFTNTPYSDAPRVPPPGRGEDDQAWQIKSLTGQSSHAFERQIHEAIDFVQNRWPVDTSHRECTAGIVLYRSDQRFVLDAILPRPGQSLSTYDLVVAAQAYRSRLDAATKVNWVLAPLARKIAAGGRMIVVQSTGRDPGMDIVRKIWPAESPFRSSRGSLTRTLNQIFAVESLGVSWLDLAPEAAEYSFELQLNPEDVSSNIGTSTLLAAWNAAAYVAQIDERRLTEAMSQSSYLAATRQVLTDHGGLWFRNECFVVARPPDSQSP